MKLEEFCNGLQKVHIVLCNGLQGIYAKLGELLRKIEPKYSMGSVDGTNRPHRKQTLPPGINKKQSQKAGEMKKLLSCATEQDKRAPDDRGDKPHKDSETDSPNLTAKQKITKDTGKKKDSFPWERIYRWFSDDNEEGLAHGRDLWQARDKAVWGYFIISPEKRGYESPYKASLRVVEWFSLTFFQFRA